MIKKKIILSISICFIFALSISVVSAFSGLGTGTSGDPYQITNCTQLNETRDNLTASYILNNNIDCADTINWYGGAGWLPVGRFFLDGVSFNGSLDGNNYNISNLYINRNDADDHGLFGTLDGGAEVNDVGLINVNITGGNWTGAICGNVRVATINNSFSIGNINGNEGVGGLSGSFTGTISNSYFSGNISGSGDYVGGLFGDSAGSILNSYSTVNIDITGYGFSFVGGLVGSNAGSISNSYSTGVINSIGFDYIGGVTGTNPGTISNSYSNINVTSDNSFTGGLVGYVGSGSISNSYSTGNVKGLAFVGGLVGRNHGSISNSYSTGNVSGASYTGGLIGWNNATIYNSHSNGSVVSSVHYTGGLVGRNHGSISNSYSTGNVKGLAFVGGLIGRSYTGSISNSYSTGNVIGGGSGEGGFIGILESGSISNSYSTGNVSGTGVMYMGGFVGDLESGSISNSYSTGSVNVTGSYGPFGGLLGNNYNGYVYNSFWDTESSGMSSSDGGTGKTTSQMKNISTFLDSSWDIALIHNWFNNTWFIDNGNDYPKLEFEINILGIQITQPVYQIYPSNESIQLNFTIINSSSLDTCWYYILNSTGGYEMSNTTITNCQNTTFNVSGSDLYIIYLYANETTSGIFSYDNISFRVSLNNPAIVLDYPANDKYFNNGNNIYYNFTATDPDGLSTCQLWSNWNGVWHNNYTWINPTNGTQNFTVVNLTDFSGIWNVWCNDSLGNGGWSISNRTGGVDTVYPLVNITSPLNSSSSEGLALTISYNVSDLNQGTCFFTLRDSNGTIHNYAENTSVTCSESGSRAISTLVYGTYTFQLYGKDKAGNTNSTTITFTNTAPEPGGGGGTAVEVKVVDVVTFARDESLTGAYEILDLAKIYVPFYRECTSRFPDEKCKLENDILVKISNELSLKVGSYNIMDRDKFYEMYLNGNTEVHEVTLDIANEFNLIRDTEGIILLLKPIPNVFDQWWIKEKPWTDEGSSKEYVIKFNKPIKDCQVINGNGNQTYKFECELIVEESGYSNSAIMRITETDDTVFSNSYDTQIMWAAVEKDQNTFQGIKVRMINVGYKSFFTFGVPFIYSIIIYLVLFFIGLAVFINIRSGKKNKWTRFLD